MRRISALLLAFLLALTLAAPAFAATTIPVKAFVKENFERAPSDMPCEFDEAADTFTCFGRGNAGRFGPHHIRRRVHRGQTTRTITLRDGSTSPWRRSTAMEDARQVRRGPRDFHSSAIRLPTAGPSK